MNTKPITLLFLFIVILTACKSLNDRGNTPIAILHAAALQGNMKAEYMLGNIYYYGDHDLPRNYNKAVFWNRKSAMQGYANAENLLGTIYYLGRGVQQDYAKAIFWYRKSAAQGNSRAEYNLGVIHTFGRGGTKDYSRAIYWYGKSAMQGYEKAELNLASLYNLRTGRAKGLYQSSILVSQSRRSRRCRCRIQSGNIVFQWVWNAQKLQSSSILV